MDTSPEPAWSLGLEEDTNNQMDVNSSPQNDPLCPNDESPLSELTDSDSDHMDTSSIHSDDSDDERPLDAALNPEKDANSQIDITSAPQRDEDQPAEAPMTLAQKRAFKNLNPPTKHPHPHPHPPHHRSLNPPTKPSRPRLRLRPPLRSPSPKSTSSNSEESDEEGPPTGVKRPRSSSPVSRNKLGSSKNPIDVDSIASLFEPILTRDFVRNFILS